MKARFKTIILSALSAIAAFTAVTYTSCNNDKCKAIVCAYGGVCKDGACICPTGYEGTQCEIITRDKYKGVWNVIEKGTYTLTNQYQVSIEDGASMNKMVIRGFYNNATAPVDMIINGDEVTIPLQTVDNRYEIQGTGTLKYEEFYGKHGTLTVRYTIKDKTSNMVNDFGVNTGEPSIWSK
ncbi:MAG TPA: hypothetical protein VGD89_13110 [Flavipsychrobacter sp.]